MTGTTKLVTITQFIAFTELVKANMNATLAARQIGIPCKQLNTTLGRMQTKIPHEIFKYREKYHNKIVGLTDFGAKLYGSAVDVMIAYKDISSLVESEYGNNQASSR